MGIEHIFSNVSAYSRPSSGSMSAPIRSAIGVSLVNVSVIVLDLLLEVGVSTCKYMYAFFLTSDVLRLE